jgi:U4/U6.U5 tri-snRNP-associated protein 2
MKDVKEGFAKGSTKYNLIANICHEGEPNKGSYRVHILNKANDQWYEIQDLTVKPILAQLIVLSESYIGIFERQ